jgi:hypothetical protein
MQFRFRPETRRSSATISSLTIRLLPAVALLSVACGYSQTYATDSGYVAYEETCDLSLYADADLDYYGFGEPIATGVCLSSIGTLDANGFYFPPPGQVLNNGDCDDTNPEINPAGSESCDGLDDDCDGEIDEDPAFGNLWYPDADGDGYGVPTASVVACDIPGDDWAGRGGDCDDTNPDVNAGQDELCSTDIDDNCDGQINENGAADATVYYADLDGDGYGNPDSSVAACIQPAAAVIDATDCNDWVASVHPGATEVCGDNVDNNCDGQTDEGC